MKRYEKNIGICSNLQKKFKNKPVTSETGYPQEEIMGKREWVTKDEGRVTLLSVSCVKLASADSTNSEWKYSGKSYVVADVYYVVRSVMLVSVLNMYRLLFLVIIP